MVSNLLYKNISLFNKVCLYQGSMVKDVTLSDDLPTEFLHDKHAEYIGSYGKDKSDYEYCMTEYLRLSGVYWGLTTMDLLNSLDR